jgi:hypothetical protein
VIYLELNKEMRERDYLLCEERGRKKRKKDLETDGL